MALSTLAPGFRFHPTDDELVMFYLKRKLLGKITGNAIAEVNIYDFSPWDLPGKSSLRSRDLEWFFFCPRARKYSCGTRANRTTESGFWKATGKDRKIEYRKKVVAIRKTLIFHRVHAGNGERTNWVMHEYKIEDEHLANAGIIQDVQDMYVLCKIFEKSGIGPKNGAQYGAPFNEEEWDDDVGPDGATIPLNHKQKSAGTTKMAVAPQSGLSVTEPGSSSITFSAHETTSTLNYKPKGPATMDLSTVTGIAPSTVMFSANETTNRLNYRQKGLATTNPTVPRNTHGLSLTEPGSSTFTFSANVRHVDIPANNDVMLFEDVASIMGASTDIIGNNINEIQPGIEVGNDQKANYMAPNEEKHIYDDLINLVDLDPLNDDVSGIFKNDGTEYILDSFSTADDLDTDLGAFYVD